MEKRKILGNVLSAIADVATTVLFAETVSDITSDEVFSP